MKKSLILACVVFVAVVLLTIGFLSVGHLLIVETEPQKADVGFILAGHFSRAQYAADLYHKGFIPKIWISRPIREPPLKELDALGVLYPRQEDISRAILLKKGVPGNVIQIVGNGAINTLSEARFIEGFLRLRPHIQSLLIITSRFHVRRADAIFKKIVNQSRLVKIVTVGTPYDGFVADYWWTDRESTRQVILESAKIILFWVGGEF